MLTNKEAEVLAEFIDTEKRYGEKMNIFTSEFKKMIAASLGMENFNILNIYMKALVEKRALLRSDDGGYRINPALVLGDNQQGVEIRWSNE